LQWLWLSLDAVGVAGTHVCLRWVRAGAIYQAIAEHGVTTSVARPS